METINLHIYKQSIVPVLFAKQGDVGRKFKAVLTDGTAGYTIPADTVFSVWFSGASGEGNYSAIDGRSAFTISGNTVEVELITQMLNNKGQGVLCLVMNNTDGTQIGTWNIPYEVEAVPGMGSAAAQQHYTALSEVAAAAAASAARAEAAAKKLTIDDTLSQAGQAAESAAVGASLAKKLSAVESEEYPGCYYRMVGEEQEWLNPPMVFNMEHRTAERYNGKPVYIKRLKMDSLPTAATTDTRYKTAPLGVNDVRVIEIEGASFESGYVYEFPYINTNGTPIAWFYFNQWNQVQVWSTTDLSARSAEFTVKYIKEA